MDVLTQEQRHKNMSHIRCKDTTPEVELRKTLWKAGIRYRKNYTGLPGKPDIVITKCKIVIFVDGDFWHGRNLERIQTRREFWIPKLQGNIERDKQVNDMLTEMGWLVMRFWESDLKKDLKGCVKRILAEIPRQCSRP